MKKFLILILIILLSGCSLIEQPKKITLNSYFLEAAPSKTYTINKTTLLVNKPKISKSFNTKEIIYTQKPYSYESYAKSRWLTLPSSIIKNELVDSLRSSNIFQNVIDIHSKAKYEYLLESSVSKLYHKYEGKKSFAILKANFKLIHKNKVIESLNFNKKILCQTNTPYGFVKAANQAFNEVLVQLTKKLAK